MTLRELQEENRLWANRNFPQQDSYCSLLGAMEELGELAHAHLKEVQGIRGTAAKHEAKAKDAIGDIIIYLAHYCTTRGFDLETVVAETWAEVRQRDWQANRENGMVQ